jgi:hypothetical protein
MCLLTILHRTSAVAPLLVAANREEFYDRPFTPPELHDQPRILCGRDKRAGGTWLGVNPQGVTVAITNRLRSHTPAEPRSRGLLCQEALGQLTAEQAAGWALSELRSNRYGGCNVVCADRQTAWVVSGMDEPSLQPLPAGLHLIANGAINDPNDMRVQYARWLWAPRFPGSVADFVSAAQFVMTRTLDDAGERTILVEAGDRGTVCSLILAVTHDPQQAVLQYTHGRPDRHPYEDRSALLRQILSEGAGR